MVHKKDKQEGGVGLLYRLEPRPRVRHRGQQAEGKGFFLSHGGAVMWWGEGGRGETTLIVRGEVVSTLL